MPNKYEIWNLCLNIPSQFTFPHKADSLFSFHTYCYKLLQSQFNL
uniref:Uncharacterized protein n=1 Tax=Anguilla anguilla TaxID=7936 RepID=A0A0E9XJ26_ANGAN